MDVLRVLATILLLGNIEFVEGEGLEVKFNMFNIMLTMDLVPNSINTKGKETK